MPRIVVNVTQERIERGEPLKCRECPIALALMEGYGFAESDISVDAKHCYFWTKTALGGWEFQKSPLPQKAGGFIRRFDMTPEERMEEYGSPDPPAPFTFELDLPFTPPKGAYTD